ncbi:MAG: T9SS type A sorting domain-containing protein, partial [Flavobacteriaceae bacterium]|nr:T9SS type A sorting domain-containing protein [Flavobacteriaceae bacterium]
MMKTFTLLFALLIASTGFSQNSPIDFEAGGFGADWTWTVFENETNPPLEIIANPDPTGVNTSSTVAKFTALQAGAPFAGCETMHGADIGTFDLTADNAIVKIMVWKSVISDVGIKFVQPNSASTGEFKVANTLVNQWEELTFDFTAKIGEPESVGIDQLVVFPDFDARTSDNIIYFDNITFGDGTLGLSDANQIMVSAYPNPVANNWNIRSNEPIKNIRISSLTGASIIAVNPNSTDHSLDLSFLTAGIYFAIVETQYG